MHRTHGQQVGRASPLVVPAALVQAPGPAMAQHPVSVPGDLSPRPAGQLSRWVHGSAALDLWPHVSVCLLARLWPQALLLLTSRQAW